MSGLNISNIFRLPDFQNYTFLPTAHNIWKTTWLKSTCLTGNFIYPGLPVNGICQALCIQYIPRNMHTVFALLCFVVVIHWLIFPYPSGLLHWHCGNLMIAPVPAKQPWWIWINTSCEFIMNDCITTTKQSTTKLCAYFLGYTVQEFPLPWLWQDGLTIQTSVTYGKYNKKSLNCGQWVAAIVVSGQPSVTRSPWPSDLASRSLCIALHRFLALPNVQFTYYNRRFTH